MQSLKIILFPFLFIAYPAFAFSNSNIAKDSVQKELVVKVNLVAFAAKTISVQGELGLTKHLSTCLGIAYMPNRELPFGAGDAIKPYFNETKYNSLYITPEVRYYPFKNQHATKGFYMAGYLRYKHTNFNTVFSLSDSSVTYSFPIHYSADAIALGGMLGYQFKLKRLSIDLWVLSLHGGYQDSNVNIDITGLGAILDEPFIKDQIDKTFTNSNVPNWFRRKAEYYLQQNDVNFGWGQPYIGMRSGITIGFRF